LSVSFIKTLIVSSNYLDTDVIISLDNGNCLPRASSPPRLYFISNHFYGHRAAVFSTAVISRYRVIAAKTIASKRRAAKIEFRQRIDFSRNSLASLIFVRTNENISSRFELELSRGNHNNAMGSRYSPRIYPTNFVAFGNA